MPMSRRSSGCRPWLVGVIWCLMAALPGSVPAAGGIFEVEYPASTEPGKLIYGVTYTIWIPDGVETLRGVIVHQHGCGSGACKGGATAAYDLHWQALARKWNCALLGPYYHQEDGQDCRQWCDPRNGSNETFLRCLDDLAQKSGHPELSTVPWCLWGHSGGGFWASLMQTMHPERIVAIWFRSGTAFEYWEKGEIPRPEIPEAAYGIPMMLNPGLKERDDARFASAWTGSWSMLQAYRAHGAPAGFAPDPRSGHECADSRYLAIPFFDACLELRLPDVGSATTQLKPVDLKSGWLVAAMGAEPVAAQQFSGAVETASWLPNEKVARAWTEYVRHGWVTDKTPPAAPRATFRQNGQDIEIQWEAVADFESGLQSFQVLRDGQLIGQVPEQPIGRFGKPLFQTMSYHDTPEAPLPRMIYVDRRTGGKSQRYEIIAVNGEGLKSEPAAVVKQGP